MVGRASATTWGTRESDSTGITHRYTRPPHFRHAGVCHSGHHSRPAEKVPARRRDELRMVIWFDLTPASFPLPNQLRSQRYRYMWTEENINPSSVFNSISPTSGDGSDFCHYCAEIIALGCCMVSASGRLPRCVPIIRRKGSRLQCFR
jgi:hypothetical protein